MQPTMLTIYARRPNKGPTKGPSLCSKEYVIRNDFVAFVLTDIGDESSLVAEEIVSKSLPSKESVSTSPSFRSTFSQTIKCSLFLTVSALTVNSSSSE
uniref:Uncharacterized protein n=1 Tax=Romanomermis culicivorax TaxID=13658 RepID=A0A915HL24_ROMCU